MTMCPHNDDTPEKYRSQDTRNKLSEDEPGRQVVQQKHQADLRQRQVEGLGIFKIRWKMFFKIRSTADRSPRRQIFPNQMWAAAAAAFHHQNELFSFFIHITYYYIPLNIGSGDLLLASL